MADEVEEVKTTDLTSVSAMVEEYATTAGQDKDIGLSASLVIEEFEEWKDELYYSGVDQRPFETEAELKELADLVYVIHGRALTMGYDLDKALKRVHYNNMGRMLQPDGTIKRRSDGKIIKNPEYPKVDLGDLV